MFIGGAKCVHLDLEMGFLAALSEFGLVAGGSLGSGCDQMQKTDQRKWVLKDEILCEIKRAVRKNFCTPIRDSRTLSTSNRIH